jgi:hypothetical protein
MAVMINTQTKPKTFNEWWNSRTVNEGRSVEYYRSIAERAWIDGSAAERTRAEEAEADIANAVKFAKEYDPEYPWELSNTASEAVWALGEGGIGAERARQDWILRHDRLDLELQEVKEKLADRIDRHDRDGKALLRLTEEFEAYRLAHGPTTQPKKP